MSYQNDVEEQGNNVEWYKCICSERGSQDKKKRGTLSWRLHVHVFRTKTSVKKNTEIIDQFKI